MMLFSLERHHNRKYSEAGTVPAADARGTADAALTFVCRGLGARELARALLGCRALPLDAPLLTRATLPAAFGPTIAEPAL